MSTVAAAIDAGSEAAAEPFARPATTDSWDPVREPVRGGVAYPPLAALPGLEQVRAFLAGRAPAPSVSRLTGRRIVDASVGSATYALPATDWMVGPKGAVHSGALAVLADGASIASVISALPARVLCTTAELSMTFLGSPPSPGGDLTARGRLLHLDADMALAEVHVHDARATGRSLMPAPKGSECDEHLLFPCQTDHYLRTRNRRMVVSPDRLLLSGSSSVLVMPGEEKRTPSPSSTGST